MPRVMCRTAATAYNLMINGQLQRVIRLTAPRVICTAATAYNLMINGQLHSSSC